MDREFKDLLERLREIATKGFIPTIRKGNTGVGMTLESHLGILENNLGKADWKEKIEIKAQREGTSSKITLFTKSPKRVVALKWSDIVLKYGYIDEKGRRAIYRTFSVPKEVRGWKLRIENTQLILSCRQIDIGAWNLNELFGVLKKKLQGTVFVFAKSRKINNLEHFHYHRYVFGEWIEKKHFIKLLTSGGIVVDFRMHLKENGQCRDHGTAFRIDAKSIPHLFDETIKDNL